MSIIVVIKDRVFQCRPIKRALFLLFVATASGVVGALSYLTAVFKTKDPDCLVLFQVRSQVNSSVQENNLRCTRCNANILRDIPRDFLDSEK